jgi:hypothetical protein
MEKTDLIYTINGIQYDITLYLTLFISQNLLEAAIFKTALFDHRWVAFVISTMCGLCFYGLIGKNIVKKIVKAIPKNKLEYFIIQTPIDLFRFGSIFIFQKVIGSWLLHKPINLNKGFLLNSSISFINFGPNITFRFNKNYKINNYSIQFGINSVFYNDKLNILNYNLNTNGNGLTQSLNFMYENNVSKVLNFRLVTGINAGGINTLNITENSATFKKSVKGKEGIGLSGFNFGIGLNYLIK